MNLWPCDSMHWSEIMNSREITKEHYWHGLDKDYGSNIWTWQRNKN